MEWWRPWLTRIVAADPGMRRARSAAQVIVAVALAVAAALPLLRITGQPATAVAPAAVVAMVSMLAVRERGRTGVVTTLLLPVAAAVSFILAGLTHDLPLLRELVFLVVMFVAVYIRRFGPRAFAAGMAAFIGYFLTLVLQAPLALVPAMIGAGVVGAGAALLARFVLLRERPDKAWRSGIRAMQARVHTLMRAIDDVGEDPSDQHRRRVHDELLRLNATTLSLGTAFDALDALPDDEADALRERVLDVELAAGFVVTAVDGLLDEPADTVALPAVARVTHALDDDAVDAAEVSRDVADRLDGAGAPVVGMAVRRLAAAAGDLRTALQRMDDLPDLPAQENGDDDAEPDVAPAEPESTPGLRPTTRTAIQVVVAGALSIGLGGLVVPGQWFWAVITAFVVFAGASSRGELMVRASSRVAGTLGGLLAGVVVASLVNGHPVLQLVVVLLCVFLAFYLLPLSYGLMTFFVTTMVGVLYGLLGRFSIAFLEIRLVETVIGAAAGVAAALFVLPTRTHGVVAESRRAFLTTLAQLLRDAADDLRSGPEVRPLGAAARAVDDRMHTLLASASPLGQWRFGGARELYDRRRQLVTACAAAARGFARVAGPAAATSDPDTRTRLADLAATVGDLAQAIAEQEPTADLIERAGAQEGTLVDLLEALHAGPTALRGAIFELARLRGVLTDVAREFGRPEAAPVAASRPAV